VSQHHTLRVELTVVSVVITFVRVKITLRLEITLCVYKTRACWNHTLRSEITLVRVEITLCFQKLHSCVCSSQCTCEHHTKEWFLHAECDVDTLECDYDTHESDYDTYTCQNHTLHVEITLLCDVHTHTEMNTRTNVISERKVWFQHARVWFIYVECDLYT
jgi:hypothetical protein